MRETFSNAGSSKENVIDLITEKAEREFKEHSVHKKMKNKINKVHSL